MTLLGRYLEAARQPDAEQAGAGVRRARGSDAPPPAWADLVDGLAEASDDLASARREVARLLEDDNVTYTPSPASSHSIADPPGDKPGGRGPGAAAGLAARPGAAGPARARVGAARGRGGAARRAARRGAGRPLGAHRLLASGQLPPPSCSTTGVPRPVVGAAGAGASGCAYRGGPRARRRGRLEGRRRPDPGPVRRGYAMQTAASSPGRCPRSTRAHLHRLTRSSGPCGWPCVDAGPEHRRGPAGRGAEPGHPLETAFDQAFLASLLGFPLLEGSDLLVRDGRVWMRVLGRLEQVDVVLRRVDSTWCDALELRGGSRLGVTGLLEWCAQGTVSVVNTLGSGVLENPALLPFLPGCASACSARTFGCRRSTPGGAATRRAARTSWPTSTARRQADRRGARPQRRRRRPDRRAARAAGRPDQAGRAGSWARRCCRVVGLTVGRATGPRRAAGGPSARVVLRSFAVAAAARTR